MTVRLVEAWNAAIVRLLEPVRESLRVWMREGRQR